VPFPHQPETGQGTTAEVAAGISMKQWAGLQLNGRKPATARPAPPRPGPGAASRREADDAEDHGGEER